MKRAILMAGGRGTRLDPLTRVANKHLLPVYDRPMIFYPLGTLAAMGVQEVLLVARSQDAGAFHALLGDGRDHGVQLAYASQHGPNGIAEGLIIGADFAAGGPVALALGDQLFMGAETCINEPLKRGARVYVQEVADVSESAVLERDRVGRAIAIAEKPAGPRPGLAVTGLYLFDDRAANVARGLQPSARGELEIVDVIRWYLEHGELDVRVLPPSVCWADLGTPDRLLDAAVAVRRAAQHRRLAV